MSTTKRIDPLNPETASVKKKELANNNSIIDVERCPVTNCGRPMRLLSCNGIPSYVCLEHCVALPTKDA